MWKCVAFVLLIIFSVPAVLGEDPNNPDVSSENGTSSNEIVAETTPPPTTSSPSPPPTTSSPSPPPTTSSPPPTTSSPPPTTSSSPPPPTTTSSTTTTSTTPPSPPTTTSPITPTTEAEVTTSKVTTVPPPSTTALPPPDVGKYNISEKDGNKTCLKIEMALRVSVQGTHYNFPANASTDGSDCNVTNTEVLQLTTQDHQQGLTLIFVQEGQKNYVQNITYTYYSASEQKSVKTSGHFFSATKGNSYLCHSDVTIEMENVTLTFSSVHVQAFGADSFGHDEECDADDKVGDIVPIAVGCALGALVIIVLIAYLVGRRRSHQKGYQSV